MAHRLFYKTILMTPHALPQMKRPRATMSAMMPFAALAVALRLTRGSTKVALWGLLQELGLVAWSLFRSALHLMTIATSARDVLWRRVAPTCLALVLLPLSARTPWNTSKEG